MFYEIFLIFNMNVGIFCIILLISQYIVMDLNNVMNNLLH